MKWKLLEGARPPDQQLLLGKRSAQALVCFSLRISLPAGDHYRGRRSIPLSLSPTELKQCSVWPPRQGDLLCRCLSGVTG